MPLYLDIIMLFLLFNLCNIIIIFQINLFLFFTYKEKIDEIIAF